jgi:hypothetical protein
MRFEEALKAMREGKEAKRPIYNVVYVVVNNEIRYRHSFGIPSESYEFGLTAISTKDIMAEDWEIVDE